MIASIRRSITVICISMVLTTGMAGAESYPPQSEAVVQDEEEVIDTSQIKQLNDIIEKLPPKYKIVIIPSTEELKTQAYTEELFTEYNLSPDHILFVFNADKEQLGVKVGRKITEEGLTAEEAQQEANSTFAPFAKNKSYMTGISTTAQRFTQILKQDRTDTSVGVVAAQNSEEPTPTVSGKSNSMFYYIAILIIVIIGIGLYIYFQRKKWTQEMDDIEDWIEKIEEKLKRLNEDPMADNQEGENPIQHLIEHVRKESLPEAEFNLLEADVMNMRFRFGKTSVLVQQTKECLSSIDHEISQLQSRLFQTKITEEECERTVGEIQQTAGILEDKLDQASKEFGLTFYELRELLEDIKEGLHSAPEQMEKDSASYLDILKKQRQQLLDSLKMMEQFPQLRQEVMIILERDLVQLEEDLHEMIEHGYNIPVEIFDYDLSQMKKDVVLFQKTLNSGQVQGVANQVTELKDQMDSFYDVMEEIVTKKAQVEHYLQELPIMLDAFEEEEEQLTKELEQLSIRYRVQEGAIFNYFIKLQEVCTEVRDQLFLVSQIGNNNDLEFIQAADQLEAAQERIEKLLLLREEAYLELEELRKGEFEALDTAVQLHTEINRIEQQIRRRNLPGISFQLQEQIESGKRDLIEIEAVLEDVPLDLQKIYTLVKEAQIRTNQIVQRTQQMFDLSEQVEELIQITNQYRRSSREIDQLLNEAEEHFRNAEYGQANERAIKAHDLSERYSGGKISGRASKFRR